MSGRWSRERSHPSHPATQIYQQDTAPGAGYTPPPKYADFWYETRGTTSTTTTRPRAGTHWVFVQDTGIPNAQQSADNAQGTANSKVKTFAQTTPPTAVSVGDIWYDTSQGNKQYWASAIGANNVRTPPTAGWWLAQDSAISTAASSAAAANTAANNAMTAAQQAQASADGAVRTYYQEAAPWSTNADPAVVGDMWFKNSTGVAYRWDGSAWVVIPDTAITAALAAANTAQTTADGKITAWYATAQPWPNTDATHDKDFGDLWYDTGNKNKPWFWANNRTWTVVQDGTIADAQGTANTANGTANTALSTAVTKVKSFYQTSPPTSLAAGDIWFDTDDGYKQYRASAAGVTTIAVAPAAGWNLVQDALIPQAVTTANGKNTIYYNNLAPTVAVPGPSFVVNDMWFDLSNGYAISLWDGLSWVPRPLGGTALDVDSITAREIASSYVYAGMVAAENIDTGTLTSGIVLGALIETPTTPQGGRVEIDPAGIRIIGHDATTTLQPDLSEFKGQAEVTNLTVKGTATLRSTTNELSRGAAMTMVNGVTAPGAAPSYNIDYQQLQLTGAPSGAIGAGLQWDAASSRWWVASRATGGSGIICSYDATGVYKGTMEGTAGPRTSGTARRGSWGVSARDAGSAPRTTTWPVPGVCGTSAATM